MQYQDQTPLPNGFCIIRLAAPSKDYAETRRISANQLSKAFELSSEDKKSVPPHLSVWAESLTTPQQAYNFLVENRPNSPRKLVIRLSVDDIRGLKSRPSQSNAIYDNLLDVIWIYLFEDPETRKIRNVRPGADGHSGIIGLDEGSAADDLSRVQKKILRKDLRAQLADLASRDNFLIEI